MNSAFTVSYGRSVISWESNIRTYNQDDIIRFHNNYYHPNNAILLIVDDVELDLVIELARENMEKSKLNLQLGITQIKIQHIMQDLSVTLESTKIREPLLYFRYRVPLLKNTDEAFTVKLVVEVLQI